MGIIHQPLINALARNILYPIRKVLPARFKFAIDGKIKINLGEGRQMFFCGNPTSPMLRMLFWGGKNGFEPEEYKIFVPLVKKSKVFFDIGANIGYYSLVAKSFNEKIIVHGFEPMPSANKYFHLNQEENKFNNLFIHSVAISDSKGEAEFHSNLNPKFPKIKDHLYGDSSLNAGATSNISRIKFKVQTDTLDGFCSKNLKNSEKIDLMKIDTEATEHLVLKGASRVLREHRPIIMCEVIKGFIEREVEKELKPFNYFFFEVTESGLKKADELIVEKGKKDYFFVPAEREVEIKHLLAN